MEPNLPEDALAVAMVAVLIGIRALVVLGDPLIRSVDLLQFKKVGFNSAEKAEQPDPGAFVQTISHHCHTVNVVRVLFNHAQILVKRFSTV